MSTKTDQLLIVLSILEGRNFPKSQRLSLVVQASFDGEHLATDPVEHREHPLFNTELAWELDRRTLHQHRLQRTPIKLQCFAVESVTKKKENVGYIILDLRSVQEGKQDPRWCPLLSSKYTKLRPALLLSMVLENDNKPSEPSPDRFKARKAPPRQGSPAVIELLPEKLEAVLIPDQGYHQIGPADHCSDMFVLSVTLAFATKLEQLITSTVKLSAEGSEFFFYYSLLGNDITSEPFHNLLSPSFEPERSSVRIRSSKQVLHTFLSQEPDLEIHLCCGSRSLGSTNVSLSVLALGSVDLESKAAAVEGAFILRPPNGAKHNLPADLQPTVGVSVTLRSEAADKSSVQQCKMRNNLKSHTASHPPPSIIAAVAPAEQRPRSASPVQKHRDSSPPSSPSSPLSHHTESEAESLLEEPQTGLPAAPDVGPVQTEATGDGGASSVSVSAPKITIPPSAHHYCFSLHLHTLGGLRLTHSIAATLRYTYQFFSSPAPIMTNPPVQLQRNMEVSLPQSYCAFDFSALPQHLQDTFHKVPLEVEVWHKDTNSRDQLIGKATIQLSHLLVSERRRFHTSTGQQGWRQTHQDKIPVLKPQHPTEKVAELSFVATLEDLGFVKTKEVIVSESLQNEPTGATQLPSNPAAHRPLASTVAPKAPILQRDTPEYRTALELERWKEEQEDLFEKQLRRKELSYMQALAGEVKKRDQEREAIFRKKEMEYKAFEEQLQTTLLDLKKREEQLAEAELEAEHELAQKELRAERELMERELQESRRRLQQECEHRVALERERVQLMEEERTRLLQQIADGKSRHKQLEKEFQQYREQQNIKPEFRLQSEVNVLTLEKVELERKLESTTKSKLHYKQQWGRALKELARFKQREQENAMTRLKKQQEELEALKLRYLATEQKAAVQQDRKELEDIRNDLNRSDPCKSSFSHRHKSLDQ
uniref:Centrosomal protein 120 n=1 Tax=Tetraodon nigroviridis TaxID=99883 RepID=H3CFR0_TETNG